MYRFTRRKVLQMLSIILSTSSFGFKSEVTQDAFDKELVCAHILQQGFKIPDSRNLPSGMASLVSGSIASMRNLDLARLPVKWSFVRQPLKNLDLRPSRFIGNRFGVL